MSWLSEWSGDVDDLLADFGETVTWTLAGGSATLVAAIVDRGMRGRKTKAHGTREEATAFLVVKTAALPAGWAQFDRVTIDRVKGSSSPRDTWTVALIERDYGNGVMRCEITLGGVRQYVTPGLEVD